MNDTPRSTWARFSTTNRSARKTLLAVTLAVGTAVSIHAQGDIPSGTVTGSGAGPYAYDLTFADAASSTSAIGSVWYAWVPGQFFLPGTPTSASAPAGWTASIEANSIQYTANSPANDITAGHSLSGFGYDATFSPATLAATANSGKSVAYTGGIESDAGVTFILSVPEPSSIALLALGATTLAYLARRKSRAG